MTTQAQPAFTKQHPRTPELDRETAARLAAMEYERVIALLEQLHPEQWAVRTDCPDWDVRAMAGHMLGMVQMVATKRSMARQQLGAARRAKKSGVALIDVLTALQVDQNAHLTANEIIEDLRRLAPRAARSRSRAPGFLRSRSMPDQDEFWTLGYLFDVILTRDPFMHRIDITRATGLPMVATTDHEGVIVDDVVREWAARHGAAYDLELTGPAGGHWQRGGAPRLTMDAFEFCRALSGRAPADGWLSTQVPF